MCLGRLGERWDLEADFRHPCTCRFCLKMASKAEKKRKVGGRGGPRAARPGRPPQSTVAPGVEKETSQMPTIPEPEYEPMKEESGEYLLGQRLPRNGRRGDLERLYECYFFFLFPETGSLWIALGGLKLARYTRRTWNSTGVCLPLPHKPWD